MAVGYPDTEGDDSSGAKLLVDGTEISVTPSPSGDKLRLSRQLEAAGSELEELASYVPGRILREEATLAVSDNGKAYLWQEASTSLDERELRRFFEIFLDSCDWWRSRLEALHNQSSTRFPDILIRP